jgi:hypothetical protein
MLSFASGSAIKRITAGVKARRDRSLLKSRSAAGPSPSGKISFERKENTALRWEMRAVTQNIGQYIATMRKLSRQPTPEWDFIENSQGYRATVVMPDCRIASRSNVLRLIGLALILLGVSFFQV